MRRAGLLILFVITVFTGAGAQFVPDRPREEEPEFGTSGSGPESNLLAEMRMTAALFDDFNMGGRLGVENAARRIPLAFFMDAEWRPYRRAVRVRDSETLEYQYREGRFTFGPGMTAAFPIANDSLFLIAGGGLGVSLAWYRGSSRDAPSAFVPWLETGVRFPFPKGWHMALTYQIFPLPGASSHRIGLVFGGSKRAGSTE